MVRSLPLDSDTRPELPRILAIAAAIALHAFAFLLLLVPMTTPRMDAPLADQKPTLEWILPKVVPPPLPPDPVPVVKPQPRTLPPQAATIPRNDTPVAQMPVIVDNGSLAADPVAAQPTQPELAIGGGAPLQGVQLEYAVATAPRYPIDAIRAGAEGTVLLKILVDIDGKPLEVTVQQSSGNRSLDREARNHVLKTWRFKPAMRDGHPVQAYGLVPVDFTMQ